MQKNGFKLTLKFLFINIAHIRLSVQDLRKHGFISLCWPICIQSIGWLKTIACYDYDEIAL